MLRVAFLTASSSCLSTISRFTPAERQFVRHRLRKCFTSHFCVREIPACPQLPRLSTTSVCVRFPPVHDFVCVRVPACPQFRDSRQRSDSLCALGTEMFHIAFLCACDSRLSTTFRMRARLLLDAAVGDANSSLGSGRDRFVVRHHHQRHALGVRGSE